MSEHDIVAIGGLMRCCLATLNELYPDGPAKIAVEGQVLPCNWCKSSMVFSNGTWRWNRNERNDHG